MLIVINLIRIRKTIFYKTKVTIYFSNNRITITNYYLPGKTIQKIIILIIIIVKWFHQKTISNKLIIILIQQLFYNKIYKINKYLMISLNMNQNGFYRKKCRNYKNNWTIWRGNNKKDKN